MSPGDNYNKEPTEKSNHIPVKPAGPEVFLSLQVVNKHGAVKLRNYMFPTQVRHKLAEKMLWVPEARLTSGSQRRRSLEKPKLKKWFNISISIFKWRLLKMV